MKKDKKKGSFGLGLMLTGVLAAAGATAIALIKQKKREEVYHEAELKAMNELDDLIAESEAEACEACLPEDQYSAVSEPDEEQIVLTHSAVSSDDDEEPIEDVADADADEEDPEA